MECTVSKSAEAACQYSCMLASLLRMSAILKEFFSAAKVHSQHIDGSKWKSWCLLLILHFCAVIHSAVFKCRHCFHSSLIRVD